MPDIYYLLDTIVLTSIVTASVSFLIIDSKLFQWFRNWVKECPLFKCGICFGHWVALALVIGLKVRLFGVHWFVDITLSTLVIAWLGGLGYIFTNFFVDMMEDVKKMGE